jgi:hypothetical protein
MVPLLSGDEFPGKLTVAIPVRVASSPTLKYAPVG